MTPFVRLTTYNNPFRMSSTLVSLASRIGCVAASTLNSHLVHSFLRCRVAFALPVLLVALPATAEDTPVPLPTAATMLSADTQALFSLPDSPKFFESWDKTQLGKLAADDALKQFWKNQREEIQDRFQEAGWQLSLEIEDLNEISSGQTTLAWISRAKDAAKPDPAKPYSIAMIVDVGGKEDAVNKLLQRIDTQLKAKNATSKVADVSGAKVKKYSFPKIAGEPRIRESFYTLSKNQLLATDDLLSIAELLAAQTGDKTDSLAKSPLYKSVLAKTQTLEQSPEIEYFVRPIGFAKLLRSISGKPSNNQSDLLKILDSEGFGDLKCFSGNIQIANGTFDFFHNGYLIAKKPASPSVQILDFPNINKLVPPGWINMETATVISFSWNLKNAFPKFKGIVDAFVGKDTFETVIEGIRDDPQGPQIDIVKEVLPNLTTEFHIVTEIVKPIAPESKRSMVILKLNDPNKKLNKVVERFGKAEPNASPIDVEGFRIWRVKNDVADEVVLDFGKGNEKDKPKEADSDEPLLDQWAITIMDNYFIFASDAEMIIDTIRNAKKNAGAFALEPDVLQVSNMLNTVVGKDGQSFSSITRSDRAFEMQYELFREGILPESKSMLATILDRILKPKNPRQGQPQKVQGAALPPFNTVSHFFNPSGGDVKTEDDGWSFKSFILSK